MEARLDASLIPALTLQPQTLLRMERREKDDAETLQDPETNDWMMIMMMKKKTEWWTHGARQGSGSQDGCNDDGRGG